MILWIIVAILMFSVIILAHEYWHFKTARIFWVKVYEFGLWIPPRAKKIFTDKKWTLYSLNWLPLGWFVRLAWENIHTFKVYDEDGNLFNNEDLEKAINEGKKIYDDRWEEIPVWNVDEMKSLLAENNSPESLLNKPDWQQAIVILAWVTMNFLLAIIVFSILFFVWVKPIWINSKIETDLDIKLIPTIEQAKESGIFIKKDGIVVSPLTWSVAQSSGLQESDIITKINSQKISDIKLFQKTIKDNANKEIILEIQRNDNLKEIKITPSKDWKIWSYIWENIEINKDFEYKYGLIDSIKYWSLETYNQSLLTLKALWILMRKIFNPETPKERTDAINSVSWPVWTVDVIAKIVPQGFIVILVIWAIISINLWIFNLLPIPALDWWRFLFLSINGIVLKIFWKKAINERLEAIIHTWFFVFLIWLSIIIAYNDISRIINN